jgi:hypothetical protein
VTGTQDRIKYVDHDDRFNIATQNFELNLVP